MEKKKQFDFEYTLIFLDLSLFSIIRIKIIWFYALNFRNDIRMHFYLQYTLIFFQLSLFSIIRNKII